MESSFQFYDNTQRVLEKLESYKKIGKNVAKLALDFIPLAGVAANTVELFGIESGVFIAIACSTAYLFSGHSGVYSSQIIGSPKTDSFATEKGLSLSEIEPNRAKKESEAK